MSVALKDTAHRRTGSSYVALVVFLLTLACYSYFVQVPGWNQTSRMALIMSVVAHQQLTIDPYAQDTGDKAWYKGHYYSDKAIGTAVLGAPAYALFRQIQHLDRYATAGGHLRYPLYLVTVLVVGVPSAILSVLLYYLIVPLSGKQGWALLLSLLYSFGTLAFPFSTMLFEHQDAAVCAFASFVLLVKARLKPGSPWVLLLAGTMAGLAVVMEYQAVLIVVVLGVYAATFVHPRRYLLLSIMGGAPWALLLAGYNWVTLGSPFRFAYQYVANPAFAAMQQGFFGLTLPRWSAVVALTVGPRGLLMQSVFLWLLPLGIWGMYRVRHWRRECVLCVGIGIIFVLWNAAYYLPLGGDVPGARFLIPALPFLMVPLAFLPRLPRPYASLCIPVVLLAGLWSIGLYALICITDPTPSLAAGAPVNAYWLSLFRHGELLLNLGMVRFGRLGMHSLDPLLVVVVVAINALIVASQRHTSRLIRGGSMAALVLSYLIVAFPLDVRQPAAIPSFFSAAAPGTRAHRPALVPGAPAGGRPWGLDMVAMAQRRAP